MTIQRLLAKLVGLAFICVLFTQQAFSQTKRITGKIKDDKGAPLAGVSVTVRPHPWGPGCHRAWKGAQTVCYRRGCNSRSKGLQPGCRQHADPTDPR